MEPLTYLTLSLSRMHAHTHPHALSFPLSHTHTHTLFPSLSLFLVGPAKKTVRWLAPKQRYTGENKLDEGKGRSVRWLWLCRADVQTDMVFKQAIWYYKSSKFRSVRVFLWKGEREKREWGKERKWGRVKSRQKSFLGICSSDQSLPKQGRVTKANGFWLSCAVFIGSINFPAARKLV